MIDGIRGDTGHSVRIICSVLAVPRSSYYHAAAPTPTQLSDERIGKVIEEIFKSHQGRYGHRRISAELAAKGLTCAPARLRRIMRERGLKALQPRSFTPKTSDGRADCPSPNLLLDQPLPDAPDKVWAGDITYIPVGQGWMYLAVVLDLCSRKVVGWALADHLRAGLVTDALRQALGSRRPPRGLIFHSDRGSQYGSREYRALLQRHGIRQSMSARANPYHNAWTESFMGTLKTEMLQGGCFIDARDARTELFAYIDSYYNTHRRHSSLGYLSPAEFEAQNLSLN
ncbi:MAG: IS3 family transposase [Verrucomicrobiaceae bacterium]|nr:MAG: IS3 family transposase [Verrucomicrobiaceae bacterium]